MQRSSLVSLRDSNFAPRSALTVKRSITFLFGTRPEAIKLAPVVFLFRKQPEFDCRVCVTGQHREMLNQVLQSFDIRPDINLDIMRPDQTLAEVTAASVTAIDAYLAGHRSDLLLVQGDTTTAFCGALAAFYNHVPVAHVEAGLRTGNLNAPWPEEANRAMISRIADLHFAPTESARENLLREHIPGDRITVTGNTGIDALFHTTERAQRDEFPDELRAVSGFADLVLITGHRRESFGDGFEGICRAIAELAAKFPGAAFVYPVHLNPKVRNHVFPMLGNLSNVFLTDPLSYPVFVSMIRRARVILTDSGGIQEEAPSLGKPVLVLRETTERPEAVEQGAALLVGTDASRIVAEASRLLTDHGHYEEMSKVRHLFGDGHASARILSACQRFLAAP